MHGDCSISVLIVLAKQYERVSNNALKKHRAIISNLYIDMMTFIRRFPLVLFS